MPSIDLATALTLIFIVLYLLFIYFSFLKAEKTYLYDEDLLDCTELNKEDETTHA